MRCLTFSRVNWLRNGESSKAGEYIWRTLYISKDERAVQSYAGGIEDQGSRGPWQGGLEEEARGPGRQRSWGAGGLWGLCQRADTETYCFLWIPF